jgi:uncharacterized membrane protein
MGALFLLLLVVLVLLLVFIARSASLSGKIGEVEARLTALEQRLAARPPQEPIVPRVVETSPPGAILQKTELLTEAPPPTPATPSPLFPSTPAPPQRPSRTKEEWEALIGGKLLNRIGAFALIIGVGFFLKYAFDQNWLTESVRVLIGVLIGVTTLLAAARSHRKGFQIFAQGLVGAGIAILYLSVYASFNFYALVSQPVAFALMAGVTIVAFTQAFTYDSLAVSLLAWLGGFVTPILLNSGESNELGLFSYLTLLNIGLIAVLLRKESWAILEPLSLLGTYSLYFTWFNQQYTDPDLGLTLVFLVIFWGLFHLLDVARGMNRELSYPELRRGEAWINAALFTTALFTLIDPQYHRWMGLATATVGMLYLITAVIAARLRPGTALPVMGHLLTAVTLLAIAALVEFNSFMIIIAWTLEALIVLWAGVLLRRGYLWGTGIALLGLSSLTLLGMEGSLAYAPIEEFRLLFNPRFLAFVLLAGTIGFSPYLLRRLQNHRNDVLVEVLQYGWILLLLLLVTVETNDYFRLAMLHEDGLRKDALNFTRYMVLAVIWAITSLPLIATSVRRFARPTLFGGIWILFAASCMAALRGITFDPIAWFVPLLNLRCLSIAVIVAASAAIARWLKSAGGYSEWVPELRSVIRVSLVALILVLMTGEIRDYFQRTIAETSSATRESVAAIRTVENIEQMSLSGGWLFFSILLMGFGIWRRDRTLRIFAIVLFGLTILKIFLYDLSFLETVYRIVSFIALGVILLAVSYLYQRYRAIIFEPSAD